MEDGDGLRKVDASTAGSWPLPRGAAATRSLSQICASFLLDAFALGAAGEVLSNLTEALRFEGSLGTGELAVFGVVWTLASFTTVAFWERLADRTGRRLTCLVSGLCRSSGLALMAIAPSNGWLGAAVALWGAGAGALPLATDFVADLLPSERRPAGFGLLLVSVALGLAAGANVGGLLPSHESSAALWICSSICIASCAYGWCSLPECRRREGRSGARCAARFSPSEPPGRSRGWGVHPCGVDAQEAPP